MKRPLSVILVAGLVLPALSTEARATPSHLTNIAAGGVVAVQEPGGIRTGFAFGGNSVITGTSVSGEVRLITAHGFIAGGDIANSNGELAVLQAPQLHLLALRRSATRKIHADTLAYLLGPPLGYGGERIREVRLPAIALSTTKTAVIAGQLPKSFQGSPVVTPSGRVIGAVASVGATNWMLATRGHLSTLVIAANKSNAGKGLPILSIVVALLALIAAIGGLIALRTRRRHKSNENAPVIVQQRPIRQPTRDSINDPTDHATQPLVRRRGPEAAEDEDFNIILKSQEDR